MAETPRPLRFSEHQRSDVMPEVRRVGQKFAPQDDIYHFVLTRSWTQFFLLVALGFVVINAMFALVYMSQPGSVQNARPHSFEDHFFFSVHTLATIGYGSMAPQTRFANFVVTFQAFLGMIMVALMTGMTFAKFARPTARVLFANRMVVQRRDGVPHLLFRVANWRHNQIVEAQLAVMVLLVETTREGETLRRPVPLELVRAKNAMFSLSWLAMHRIDEQSPFFGDPAEVIARLRAQKAEVFVSLSGMDETMGQQIVARHRYQLDEIAWEARYADILSVDEEGKRTVDYHKFHDVEPLRPSARE